MELRTKTDAKTKENSLLFIKKTCCTISAVNSFSYIPEKKAKASITLCQQYINLLRGKKKSDKNYVHIILSGLQGRANRIL
jgi:hypothetical protein